MSCYRLVARIAAATCCLCALTAQQPVVSAPSNVENWSVTVGKSLVVDSPLPIARISVADGLLADAVAVGPGEVLINGKAPGETSVVVWQTNGSRLLYDLTVRVNSAKVDAVRQQIAMEFPGEDVTIALNNDAVFVRGTVKNVVDAGRVANMAATLGKVVNLLHVDVPPVEAQIMVKVRFCDVDRSASRALSMDLASGAFNQNTAIGTDQPVSLNGSQQLYSLSEAVNMLLFRNDLNLVDRNPGAGQQEPAGDAGGANRACYQRQAGQFRGRRRVPVPHGAARLERQQQRYHHCLARVRHPFEFPPGQLLRAARFACRWRRKSVRSITRMPSPWPEPRSRLCPRGK